MALNNSISMVGDQYYGDDEEIELFKQTDFQMIYQFK